MRSARPGIWLGGVLLAATGGCSVVGPASVRTGRASYNVAIQQTAAEQLLLNLVRLRYRDAPFTLEVVSVSTSYDLSASVSGSTSLPESAGKSYGLAAGASLAEKPTVTYTPLQGDKFVTQLMSPIDVSTILLLYHSGWSVERIFAVAVQSLNGLPNAPSASGPTPDRVPVYEDFARAIRLLRALQVGGHLTLGHSEAAAEGKPVVALRLSQEAVESKEVAELCQLLGLDPGRTSYPLTASVGGGGKDRLAIVPRSLMGSLFYISQAVEAPPSDRARGLVTVTKRPDGSEFDWSAVTGDLIHIHSSALPPGRAYARIWYRGSWFYVDDADLSAKSTFMLLMQLLALQAGDIKSTGPILTLPVGR